MTELQEFLAGARALPEAEREKLMGEWRDLVWYAEHAPYKIRDKETTQLVPLKFRWGQRYVWHRAWRMAATDRPVRIAVLKARQLGVTTQWLAHKLHVCTTQEGRECYMLLHDLKPAQGKFRAAQTMLKGQTTLPAPKIESIETGRRMTFETDSTLLIESVRKQGIGRAETLHHVHTTEEPSWDDPESVLVGIEESVPELTGFETSIIRESTAEGVGDFWWHTIKKAERGQGAYELVFIPWWLEPAYAGVRQGETRRVPRVGESLADVLVEELSPGEEELGRRIMAEAPEYGMPVPSVDDVVSKLLWRRRKVEQKGHDAFMQEYPAEVDEAFRGSGRPVFQVQFTRWHRERTDKSGLILLSDSGVKRYSVVRDDDRVVDGRAQQVWRLDARRDGELHVWEAPRDDARYVAGGDPAQGEAADYSALQVLRVGADELAQVAVWHGHAGVEDFAAITLRAMVEYGGLIVPDATGIGAGYVDALVKLRPRGPHVKLYRREEIDAKGKRLVTKYGFPITEQSRPKLIEYAASIIKTPVPVFRHAPTMFQIEAFSMQQVKRQGRVHERPDAPAGEHDDLLFAWMLGAYGAQRVSPRKQRRPVVARGRELPVAKSGGSRPRV